MSQFSMLRARMRSRSRRGVILVLMTALMIGMMAMASLAIDLGLMVLTQAQLTNAVDSAALAASLELKSDGTDTATLKQLAIQEGIYAAGLNRAAGRPVELTAADFEFGQRTLNGGDFVTAWESEGPLDGNGFVNAVRVSVRFDQATGPRRRLDLYFARALGLDTVEIGSDGTAAITPRDLIFVLDVSGSMMTDTMGYNNGRNLQPLLFDFTNGVNVEFQPALADAEVSSGVPKFDWLMDRSRAAGVWGATDAIALQFFQQEFPGTPVNDLSAEPYADTSLSDTTIYPNRFWEHWKWKAYCYYTLYNHGNNAYTNRIRNQNIHKDRNNDRRFHIDRYCQYLVDSEFVPAIAGQPWQPRDSDSDFDPFDTDEVTPLAGPNSAFPNVRDPLKKFYYPAPLPPPGFDYLNLYQGGTIQGNFLGDYPGNVPVYPMAAVRQSTLFGIHAMLTDDVNAGRTDYDKIGMVTYGSFAHADLELSSDLSEAFTVAATRLTMGIGNLGIRPVANGHTNIGMGIQEARSMMNRDGSRGARIFTIQTIGLLTDGVANVGNDDVNNPGGNANAYALDQTDLCAADGIVIHSITVGNGTVDLALMEEIANRTGGLDFYITDVDTPQAQAELREVFVNIGADKIGELIQY